MNILGDPAPLATCTRCSAPLISTLAFPKAEFYCVECGAKLGFLSPRAAEPTPELTARYQALQAEWDEHVQGKLLVRGWYRDCEKCAPHDEYHPAHATAAEHEAHERALAWLRERAEAA